MKAINRREFIVLTAAASAFEATSSFNPAFGMAMGGELTSLTLIANDRCLMLGRRDWLKRWRRPCRGLAALA